MASKSICLYFQVHQPTRLRLYRFFDIGKDSHYYDDFANRTILRRIAQKCYLPMNAQLLQLIQANKGKFKVVATVSANGNVVKSGKTFTPVFLKQKNGDTARSWSLSELASNGYVYLNGTQIWSLNGIHTIKPDSVLLMRNPESVSQ